MRSAVSSQRTYVINSRDFRKPRTTRVERAPQREVVANRSIRLRSRSRALFFRCLATMLGSGVNIVSALETLSCDQEDDGLVAVCLGAAASLRRGNPLSEALSRYRGCFTRFHLGLVYVGEETGSLARVLGELAHFEEKREELRQRVHRALAYPAVVLAVAVVLFLSLGPLFANLVQEGESTTRAVALLVQLSGAAGNPWCWALVTVACVSLRRRLIAWWTSPQTRVNFRHLLARIPGLGVALQALAAHRFVGALALQIRVGANLDRAVAAAFAVTDDPVLEEKTEASLTSLVRGDTLAEALKKSGSFPSMVVAMVQCGEDSGKLDPMLVRCARMLEEELDHRLSLLVATLEPIALAAMGLFVGFLTINLVVPMTSLVRF